MTNQSFYFTSRCLSYRNSNACLRNGPLRAIH